jgi:hypothetical protein
MRTHLEDHTEKSLYALEVPMHSPRVSGNDVLLITENCQGGSESCWELNVFNQQTGDFTQLTRFGSDNLILSHRIDAGNVAFTRYATAFPFINEVYVGFETPAPPGWALSNASGSDKAVNLAMLIPPLAVVPWLRRRRIPRRRAPLMPSRSDTPPQEDS